MARISARSNSHERVRLLDASCSAVSFAEPGYLLYVRDGNVMAQRFEPCAATDRGRAAANRIDSDGNAVEIRVGAISASTNGILTFGGDTAMAQLTWFTRDGRNVGTIQSPSPLHNPTISPDGRYVAADASGSNMSIWLVDVERGTPTRLGDGVLPVWGPRGSDIVFTSRRVGGSSDLVHRSIVGASTGRIAAAAHTGDEDRRQLDRRQPLHRVYRLGSADEARSVDALRCGPETDSVSANAVQRDARAGVA